jgi:hypothetical protein
MNLYDLFVVYICWQGGGKRRPVLVIAWADGGVRIFRITSRYAEKSEAIKSKYFKINDWAQAGLDKQSYIDTGTILELPQDVVDNAEQIGRLTTKDKQRLLEFLNRI